jgi:hypothetical protein
MSTSDINYYYLILLAMKFPLANHSNDAVDLPCPCFRASKRLWSPDRLLALILLQGWSTSLVLENVRMKVEAFEYLQLPFNIKEGCIGRLEVQVQLHLRVIIVMLFCCSDN